MYSELSGYISTDRAPLGSMCEGRGCKQMAEQRLTIICGPYYNASRLFCYSCGEIYANTTNAIMHSLLKQLNPEKGDIQLDYASSLIEAGADYE